MNKFLSQTIPHRTASKSKWCRPVWWAWVFGGTYDSGNGYGWYPGMIAMVKRYYKEEWWEAGYTLRAWLRYPTYSIQ